MTKILVGIPTNSIKNYCWQEFKSALLNLTYPDVEILFVDNSKDQKNRHFIRKQGFECAYINPGKKDIKQVMAESHELLRQEAIKRGADLFHLESDIIAPPRAIEMLLLHNKDIVGFPYFIDFGEKTKLMLQVAEEHGANKEVIYPNDIQSLTGKVERVFHIGIGCILIANHVLPFFKFRWEKGNNLHADTFFAKDCFAAGIPIYCDTSQVVTHLNKKYWNYLEK